jgi:hypothetical protein
LNRRANHTSRSRYERFRNEFQAKVKHDFEDLQEFQQKQLERKSFMAHKNALTRKFHGILNVVQKAHKSIDKMQRRTYNRQRATMMKFKAMNGYSRPTSISTFRRDIKSSRRGNKSSIVSRPKSKRVKSVTLSMEERGDSKEPIETSKISKNTADKLKDKLALLENKK